MAAVHVFVSWMLLGAVCGKMCDRNSTECQDALRGALYGIAKNCSSDYGILTQYWWHTPTNAVQINSVSEIDTEKPIIFLLHGWAGSKDVHYIQVIRNAYLKRYQTSRTIITLDFGTYVPGGGILTYATAFCNAPAVAISFGKFLCDLVAHGVGSKNIHIVGHSLGAQIAGMASAYAQKNRNITVGRVTGLDPASIGYLCSKPNECRLDQFDADFVDVIHTNVGGYGTFISSGHHDFYVNGGTGQPHCLNVTIDFAKIISDPLSIVLNPVSCSHQRSCYLFAESILENSFPTQLCFPYPSNVLYMGEYWKPETTRRSCAVFTKAQFPYGLGPKGSLN